VGPRQAVRLIQGAVPKKSGTWADLGCGDGVFTRALAELIGPNGRIYAVDKDPRALSKLEQRIPGHAPVIPVLADFTRPLDLPEDGGTLDGLLFANSLHYDPTPEITLARLAAPLAPGGRVVVVEYDRRSANRWVPYPISPARLAELTAAAGLSTPEVTGTLPSAFSGVLYAAVATWPGPPGPQA
jgi:ubiquinone/menaquinone biosynthesis C-methylase UbiE